MDIQASIDRLIAARDDYFRTGTSDLTDDQYDALKEFVESSLGRPVVASHSPPPQGTGWPVVQHLAFMPSMELTARNGQELQELVRSRSIDSVGTTSWKYDGLALELQYHEGHLRHAVLRGDGHEGEDVLANVKHITSVPMEIEGFRGKDDKGQPIKFAVFGELVVSWNNLDALNELREADGKDPYRSPRNAVTVIRSKSASIHKCRLLAFKPYDIWPRVHERQVDNLRLLLTITDRVGQLNPQSRRYRKFSPVDASIDMLASQLPIGMAILMEARKSRKDVPFQLDGIVFRLNDDTCIKYKFPASSAITRVVSVTEQLGRTGVVAPVVEVEPVELDHNTVKRATGHNVDLMGSRLEGLGQGAMVLISRRGAVIPHIEEVVSPSNHPWSPREDCPSCGSRVVQSGSIRRCSADQSSCPSTSMGLIIEYCRRMSIDGFGPGVVSALMQSGLVEDPADLYVMDPEDVADAQQPGGGRIGGAIAARLCRNLEMTQEVRWGDLLGALCIQGCALSVMNDVARKFQDPDALKSATLEELTSVDGVGPERAASIRSYLDTRWDVLEGLLQVVSLSREGSGPLEGMVVCITLALSTRTRPQMEALIKRMGGSVKSSVSRKVTHLVCNTPDASTTKLNRAKELGIIIISEQVLIDMMGNPNAEEEREIDPDDDF